MEIEKLAKEILYYASVEIPDDFSKRSFGGQFTELSERIKKANERSEEALKKIGETANKPQTSKEA
jgi:hypothetical protein